MSLDRICGMEKAGVLEADFGGNEHLDAALPMTVPEGESSALLDPAGATPLRPAAGSIGCVASSFRLELGVERSTWVAISCARLLEMHESQRDFSMGQGLEQPLHSAAHWRGTNDSRTL